MTRRVGIIGAGHVGSSVALALANSHICNEIILIDKDYGKAMAEALDILDTMPFTEYHTHILATDEFSYLKNVQILINCVGPDTTTHANRLDELQETAKIVNEIFPQVMDSGFDGIIINITNPCDVITQLIQSITNLPYNRVIGTGTLLDTARLYAHIALTLQVDASRISGYVLGEHGDSQFVAWSTVQVDSFPIDFILTKFPDGQGLDLDSTEELVRQAGGTIFSRKGYTNHGIAQSAVRLIASIYNNSQSILPISAYQQELGCYIGSPVLIGHSGVHINTQPIITEAEQQKLQQSAEVIKAAFASLI